MFESIRSVLARALALPVSLLVFAGPASAASCEGALCADPPVEWLVDVLLQLLGAATRVLIGG